MVDRIIQALEGVTVALFFCGLYWLIGLIIKNIFNIEIRHRTGYTICLIIGFLLHLFLIGAIPWH